MLKHTSLSLSALGEWENGSIDVDPELVLAIQKYIQIELQSVGLYLKQTV